MRLIRNKLMYVGDSSGVGVEKKIDGFCHAAENHGYSVIKCVKNCKGYSERKQLVRQILKFDGKYVMIRSFSSYNIFFFHIFLFARLQKKILILDQPTPLCAYIEEISLYKRSKLWKFCKYALTYLGVISVIPFNRVVQYAEESSYFQLFCKKKTILVGNGIDVCRMPLRNKEYPDGKDELKLIGVAKGVAPWHGYDRIIKAILLWKQTNNHPDIYFDIVGDNNEYNVKQLKEFVENSGLKDNIRFHGIQTSDYIFKLYGKNSLAVGSIGLFRKGLSTSSVLKIREYCLAGIPFIASGKDPDFSKETPFRFVVSNDESLEDIIHVFKTFSDKRKTFIDEEIRQYAIEHLSFDAKFLEVMKDLV